VAASNGASSGTIESAGFSVKGNGKTLDSGKETTFNSEDVTFEIKGNSDEASPYAWSIKNSLVEGYLGRVVRGTRGRGARGRGRGEQDGSHLDSMS